MPTWTATGSEKPSHFGPSPAGFQKPVDWQTMSRRAAADGWQAVIRGQQGRNPTGATASCSVRTTDGSG